MYESFIMYCKREMILRKMKVCDLAKATGYKESSIYGFFANVSARDRSPKIAKAISEALGVEL